MTPDRGDIVYGSLGLEAGRDTATEPNAEGVVGLRSAFWNQVTSWNVYRLRLRPPG
jgi:hypothetical protein